MLPLFVCQQGVGKRLLIFSMCMVTGNLQRAEKLKFAETDTVEVTALFTAAKRYCHQETLSKWRILLQLTLFGGQGQVVGLGCRF